METILLDPEADSSYYEFVPWRDFLRKEATTEGPTTPRSKKDGEHALVCRDESGREAARFLERFNLDSISVQYQLSKGCGCTTVVHAATLEVVVRWLLWLLPATPVTTSKSQVDFFTHFTSFIHILIPLFFLPDSSNFYGVQMP